MSYTNGKDLYGAVSQFHERLQYELRQKIGKENIKIFMDRRDIHGGDKW